MSAKIFAIGNITRDVELSETASGTPVCRFSLAVNRYVKTAGGNERQADFYNVTAWNKLAENVAKYCKKGSKICVYGEPQIRKYTGNDGVERQSFDIQASDIEFLATKTDGDSEQTHNSSPQSYIGKGNGQRRAPRQMEEFDDDGLDGSIPF